jgi:ABC-type dipeptide/oligopeptide/nickel transport system permease component
MRKVLWLPVILFIANFGSFAYAHLARYVLALQNPYGLAAAPPDLVTLYGDHLARMAGGDFGRLPVGSQPPILGTLLEGMAASLGLVGLAFGLSAVVGVALGIAAAQVDPPRLAGWLAPLTSFGLALPGFYIGTLAIVVSLWLIFRGLPTPLPVGGFGWDLHLVLPVIALALRPAAQIAAITANLLVDELKKQYAVTARSVGHTWRGVRWRHALPAALSSVTLSLAGGFRQTLAELVLVESIFNWPGLGRLIAQTLVAPSVFSVGGADTGTYFLHPEILAALITLLVAVFYLTDVIATLLARAADPRLRQVDSLTA